MPNPPRCLPLLLLLVAGPLFARERLRVTMDDAWCGVGGIHFSGRLTEAHPPVGKDQGAVFTLWKNTRILLADGEAGPVAWRIGDLHWEGRTDASGYWAATLDPAPKLASGWHDITVEPGGGAAAGLLVVDPGNRFGIISDIDDTIMVSDVPDKSELLENSLLVPPARRQAVPGMAELYRRWLRRNPSPDSAPLFYVSASPRQFTGNLRAFLAARDFPRGVLMLRKFPADKTDEPSPHGAEFDYKLRAIRAVFASCPQVRFALFGDDGEHDPEIYADLRKQFPEQVTGIWIRHVNPDPRRPRLAGEHDTAELLATP